MSLTHRDLRKKFKNFFEKTGHKEVPPIPLVPQNDPTTLFTGSGMQQFVPNLLGEPHPSGNLLYNIQPCIRAQDIEEVGDNRHTTSFEMMGNWSLGEYFKKQQLEQIYQFLIEEIHLPAEKLFATVFSGDKKNNLPPDEESVSILEEIFSKYNVDTKKEKHIFSYGPEKNWWSRAGIPDNMPVGEPGGPDSEIFYDFGKELKLHETSSWKNEDCHVNCDCGRFLEIGNSVFMQYKKVPDGTFEELPKKNVDFGGGLERMLAASENDPDVFKTNIFTVIIEEIEKDTNLKYSDDKNKPAMRVIADHIKASVFLIINGVRPSNKEQGYVLRRLLRRSAIKMHALKGGLTPNFHSIISRGVLYSYDGEQGIHRDTQQEMISQVVNDEMERFGQSLDRGLKEIEKMETMSGKEAFDLYQSYGFPLEISEELFKNKGKTIDKAEFYKEFEEHKVKSRTSSAGKFKGGLADHSEQTVKYHTATHLLHQALFDVLGDSIRQEGSNITGERLRFDFYSDKKATDEDIKQVSEIINKKISETIPVSVKKMPKEEAQKVGARMFFREKYPDQVNVYYIGNDIESAYSKEFCGGPHVKNTKEIGKLEIQQFKKIGSNLYRIYAK